MSLGISGHLSDAFVNMRPFEGSSSLMRGTKRAVFSPFSQLLFQLFLSSFSIASQPTLQGFGSNDPTIWRVMHTDICWEAGALSSISGS